MHQPSPKMGSFPTFIRESEHSPRSLDSAFPPFNPMHKYRGVYERAGFDVNKKGYKQHQNDDRGSNRSISSSSRWGPRNQSNDSFGNKSNGSESYKTATKESLPLVNQVPDTRIKSGESSSGSSKSNSMNSYGQNNSSASTSHRTSPEYSQYHEQSHSNTTVSGSYPEHGQQYEKKYSHASNDSHDSSGQTVRTVRYDEEAENHTLSNSSPNKQHKNVKNLTLDLNNSADEQESSNQQQFASHHPSSSVHSFHSKHSTTSHHSNHSVGSRHSGHSDHSVASHHSNHSYHSNKSNGSNNFTRQEVIQEVPESADFDTKIGPPPTTTPKEDKYAQHGYQIPTPISANGPIPPPQMYNQQAPPQQPFDPRKTRKRPPIMMNGPPSGPMNPQYPPQSNRNITPPSNGAVPYPISPNYSPKLQQQPFANQMNGVPPMPGPRKVTSPNQYHPQSAKPMQKGTSPTTMYNPGMPRSMTGIPNPVGQPLMPNPGMPRSMTGIPPGPPTWQMNNQPRPQSPGYPPRSQRRPAPPPMVSPTQQQQPYFQPQRPMHPQQMAHPPRNEHQVVPPNQRYQTGVPRQPTYSQIRDDKLSPALDEFKHDLENHQSSSPLHNQTDPAQLQTMSPDLRSAKLENSLNGRLIEDNEENTQYPSEGQQTQYQQFLSTEPRNKSEDYKRGSTVSSILSKESIDEEEKRIEQELETQLQNLKNGHEVEHHEGEAGQFDNASPQKSVSGQSTVSAPRPPIPQFSVQDVDEEKKTRDSSGSNNTKDSNCDDMSIASIESIQPLSVSHSHVSPTKRDMKQMDGDVPHPYGVPERKDSAEFTKIIAELDQFEEEMPKSTPDVSDTTIEPKFGNFNETNNATISETKPRAAQYEPGTGPCRSCNQPIDPSARGSLKSIFSKTGELSGQWHRGCFKCSYQSCTTHFNKQVQCYVLDDGPYCFQHYHLLNATTCKSCGVGIEGSCIENDLRQKWHMHCLKCSSCHGQIEQDYYVVNDQIMCEVDAKQYLHNGGGSGDDKVEKRRTRMYYA
ncbi:hypothetical protein CORT_0F03230 [Candida orthopsilosis Co 90-125]|uniref:LIM zinc-binding domain-containing protein n=1 Tax=Candida orthopsilosis (strain 90-125) TaxID=1136231 RepID=H8X8S2_CANO9|nr:hypothetical protein CORT_0F03230 [Candida orthopsilosis Co 90-125]CCG24547.1 hypothetical protein CORT_0F03230 [Candida orthopsilosis Co 90-125]